MCFDLKEFSKDILERYHEEVEDFIGKLFIN